LDLVVLIAFFLHGRELTPLKLGDLIDFHPSAARMSAPNISSTSARDFAFGASVQPATKPSEIRHSTSFRLPRLKAASSNLQP
jgi:hypothetical protein